MLANFKFPPRSTIGVTDLIEAYTIVKNRVFNQEETQKLTLFGYALTGVILGETVGNPGDKSILFSKEGLLDTKEFKQLREQIDAYNIVNQRFGGEIDETIDDTTKLLNTTLKDISEKLTVLDKAT